MISSIKSRSPFVAPPLKGECANGYDVTVAYARARKKSINAEFFEAVDNFGQRLIIGEILEANRASRRAALNEPSIVANALYGDLFGNGSVDNDLVFERFGLVVSRLRDESSQLTNKFVESFARDRRYGVDTLELVGRYVALGPDDDTRTAQQISLIVAKFTQEYC